MFSRRSESSGALCLGIYFVTQVTCPATARQTSRVLLLGSVVFTQSFPTSEACLQFGSVVVPLIWKYGPAKPFEPVNTLAFSRPGVTLDTRSREPFFIASPPEGPMLSNCVHAFFVEHVYSCSPGG